MAKVGALGKAQVDEYQNLVAENTQKPTLVLHVGLPKTGTTALQQAFFPYLDDVNYMGIHTASLLGRKVRDGLQPLPEKPVTADAYWWLYRNFAALSSTNFQRIKDTALSRIPAYVSRQLPNLYSHENFFHTGTCAPILNRIERLSELKKRFDLKVIITIRRQADLALSRHFFVIDHWKRAKLPYQEVFTFPTSYPNYRAAKMEELKKANPKLDKKVELIVMDEGMNYDHIYQLFRNFLPAKNILVTPMEAMFSSENDQELIKMIHFIKGKKPSDQDIQALRQLKSVRLNEGKSLAYERAKQSFKNSSLNDKIKQLYAQSNAQLSKKLGLNLKALGYL